MRSKLPKVLHKLAGRGLITPATAALYRRLGPTGRAPAPGAFPDPPQQREWQDSLGHQCIPAVGPRDAHALVVAAWAAAGGRGNA